MGDRIAILQPWWNPGSTPMMTLPRTGHIRRRWRRFRTNMAMDSFSALAVNLVLGQEEKNVIERRYGKRSLAIRQEQTCSLDRERAEWISCRTLQQHSSKSSSILAVRIPVASTCKSYSRRTLCSKLLCQRHISRISVKQKYRLWFIKESVFVSYLYI